MRNVPCLAIPLVLLLAWSAPAAGVTEPALAGGSVEIPWPEFRLLMEQLRAPVPTPTPPRPPSKEAFTSAVYRARLEDDAVLIDAELRFHHLLADAWNRFHLLPAELALEEAELDGRPARMNLHEGQFSVLVREPGMHTARLRFRVPLHTAGGPRGFDLPIHRRPGTRLEVELPSPEHTVKVQPAGIIRVVQRGDRSLALVSLPPTEHLSVRFHRVLAPEGAKQARVSATTQTLAAVGEGLLSYRTVVDYEVLHRPVRRLSLRLPAEMTVVDVQGEGVRDWRSETDEEGRTVIAEMAFEVLGSYRLTVLGERPVEPDQAREGLSLQAPSALEVDRQVGFLAVLPRTNVEVVVGRIQGLQPVDPSELPAVLNEAYGAPVLEAYKYLRTPAEVRLATIRHRDQAVLTALIEKAEARILMVQQGGLVGQVAYRVRNKRKQYLRIAMPEGAELWGTYLDGSPVKPAVSQDGRVLIPIPRTQDGREPDGAGSTFTVELIWRQKRSRFGLLGRRSLRLPAPELYVNELSLSLYLPQSRRYSRFTGNLGEPVSGGGILGIPSESLVQGRAAGKRSYGDYAWTQQVASNVAAGIGGQEGSGALSSAALPVQITIPWSGRSYTFQRRILDQGEAPRLRFDFLEQRTGTLIRLSGLLGAVIGLTALLGRLLRRMRMRSAAAWGSLRWIGLGVLLYGASVLAVGTSDALLLGALMLALAITLVRIVRARQRGHTDHAGAVRPPAEPPTEPSAGSQEDRP